MGVGQQVANVAAASGNGRIELGRVVSVDWTQRTALVNIGGTAIHTSLAGDAPQVAATVWVLTLNDIALIIGNVARPAIGLVAGSPSGGFVSVSFDDGVSRSLPYPLDDVPSAGQEWLVDWSAGGTLVARVSEVVVESPPSVPDTGGEISQTQTFYPIDSGSYRSGSWDVTEIYTGSGATVAAWFYGNAIGDTIPDAAPIASIELYVNVVAASGVPASFGTHTQAAKPGGSFSLSSTQSIGELPAGFAGWVTLPTAWADALKTGSARGVGASGTGYRAISGIESGQINGALRIKWTE